MPVFPFRAGQPVKCECAADKAVIEVLGSGTFEANFSGFMEVVPEGETIDEGRARLALRITGHETIGRGDGIGRITVDHDFDRPAPLSELRQISVEGAFPAEQLMHVNILVTLDALPGVTLRNVRTGLLRNPHQDSFPPKDAFYDLEEPMELEDVTNPGVSVARIVSYRANINPRAAGSPATN